MRTDFPELAESYCYSGLLHCCLAAPELVVWHLEGALEAANAVTWCPATGDYDCPLLLVASSLHIATGYAPGKLDYLRAMAPGKSPHFRCTTAFDAAQTNFYFPRKFLNCPRTALRLPEQWFGWAKHRFCLGLSSYPASSSCCWAPLRRLLRAWSWWAPSYRKLCAVLVPSATADMLALSCPSRHRLPQARNAG